MKKICSGLILAVFWATSVFAADPKILPAPKVGDVKFPHEKHQKLLNNCTPCHADKKGGKIEKLAKKEEAHKLCQGCHETKKQGPTKCGECHKKNK